MLNNKVDLGKVIDPAQELDLVLDLEQGLKQVQLVEKYLQRQAMIEYTRHQLCIHHKCINDKILQIKQSLHSQDMAIIIRLKIFQLVIHIVFQVFNKLNLGINQVKYQHRILLINKLRNLIQLLLNIQNSF